MRAILDTNVLIDEVGPFTDEVAISAVTLAELYQGVILASAQQRSKRLRVLLAARRRFPDVLPVDEAVAASYSDVVAAIDAIGRKPRPRQLDLLIAATALAHGARLYTRNVDDFRGLEELIEVVSI